MNRETLQVSEIYRSIQGESTWAGLPCVFVRLTGCALRCRWCDTAHAFSGGSEMSIDRIVDEVEAFATPLVELTGGEPLEQEGVHELARRLLERGRTVLVETGGHVSIAACDPRLVRIVDWKAPGSGMESHNDWSNVDHLRPRDEIKIVIAGRDDFDWAERKVVEHGVAGRVAAILVSPVWESCSLEEIAAWVRDSPVAFRLNLQLHKIIWGEKEGV